MKERGRGVGEVVEEVEKKGQKQGGSQGGNRIEIWGTYDSDWVGQIPGEVRFFKGK